MYTLRVTDAAQVLEPQPPTREAQMGFLVSALACPCPVTDIKE